MSADAVIGSLKAVLGLDYAEFEGGLKEAQRQLKQASREFKRAGRELGEIGRNLTTWVTGPLLIAGGAVVKTAADFESAMGRVSISTGAAGDSLEALSDLAREIGRETVFSASTAADAMDMLAKAGVSVEDILGGAARAAVDLAAAAGTELDPAAAAITDTMAQFHKTAADLPSVVNQITGAVNESKLDFVDFQQAMGQAGGVAANLGVSFEDFNAVLAGTSPLFSSGSDAGTSFKTFLQRLVPTTEGAATAIQELGLSFHDAQGNLRPMREIAEQLQNSLSGLSDQAKSEYLTTIFGADAMRTALALMDQGAEGLDKISEKIAKVDAGAQAAKRMEGFNGQLEQLGGAFEEVAIVIADSGLLEMATGLVAAFAGVLGQLAQMNPAIIQAGVIFAGIAAAIGPVIMLLGGVVSAMGALTGAFAAGGLFAAGGALAAVGTALGAISAIALPVVAVIAACVAAFLLFRDDIEPVMQRLWQTLQATLGPALGDLFATVGSLLQGMGQAFMTFADGPVGRAFIGFATWMAEFWGTVLIRALTAAVRIIDGALKNIGTAFSILGDLLTGDFSGAWQGVKRLFVDSVTSMGRVIEAIFPGAIESVRKLYEGVKTWLLDKLSGVWRAVGEKLEWVKDGFFKLYDAVVGHSYVPDMVEGIAEWMAKLDAGMVVPARNATENTARAFEDLRDRVGTIMEGLLTDDERALRRINADLQAVDALYATGRSGMSRAQYDQTRAGIQASGLTLGRLERPDPDALADGRDISNQAKEAGDRIKEALNAVDAKMLDAADQFSDRFASGLEAALNGDWRGVFEAIFGDLRSQFKDLGMAIFQAFQGGGKGGGGGWGDVLSSVFGGMKIPGFKTGGSFKVGGAGAPDSRLMAMRLSPGEMVDIRKPGQDAGPVGGGGPISFDLRGAVMTSDLLGQMQGMAAASGGAAYQSARQTVPTDLAYSDRYRRGRR